MREKSFAAQTQTDENQNVVNFYTFAPIVPPQMTKPMQEYKRYEKESSIEPKLFFFNLVKNHQMSTFAPRFENRLASFGFRNIKTAPYKALLPRAKNFNEVPQKVSLRKFWTKVPQVTACIELTMCSILPPGTPCC